jgi:hypothetical protein
MKKNVAQLAGISLGLLGVLIFPYILLSALDEHCIDNKGIGNKVKCIDVRPFPVSIPPEATSSLLGSYFGAIFTFLTLYLLEKVKRSTEPKPELEITFKESEEKELVVDSVPHDIFVPGVDVGSGTNVRFGNAHYLRVKVTNKGKKIAKGCKGYLTNIELEDGNGKFSRVDGSEGSMRLLWAYEQKGSYRSSAAEQIPAGASDYLDVFVSYDHDLKPNDGSPNNKNEWFLKLKIQPQPLKYAKFIKMDDSRDFKYRFTIEVYGDGCDPVREKIIVHRKKTKSVLCSLEGDKSIIEFKLCTSSGRSVSSPPLPPGVTIERLYDLL